MGLDFVLPAACVDRFRGFEHEDETIGVGQAMEGLYEFEIEPADVDAAGEGVGPERTDGPCLGISTVEQMRVVSSDVVGFEDDVI